MKAKAGELIVLFQTINTSNNIHGGTFITHLVTPLDNNIFEIDNPAHPYIRLVGVIGKSKEFVPLNRDWSLYKSNRGQICSVETFENIINSKTRLEKQNFLFDLFNINNELLTMFNEQNNEDEGDEGIEEGAEKTFYKLHRFKERNPEIIKKAKALAILENKLFCEVCNFNFEKEYPSLGNGFIECHHRLPIATGGIRKTKVEDLALVCANCHRMLHKKHSTGKYLSIDELTSLIQKPGTIH